MRRTWAADAAESARGRCVAAGAARAARWRRATVASSYARTDWTRASFAWNTAASAAACSQAVFGNGFVQSDFECSFDSCIAFARGSASTAYNSAAADDDAAVETAVVEMVTASERASLGERGPFERTVIWAGTATATAGVGKVAESDRAAAAADSHSDAGPVNVSLHWN